MRIPIVLFCFRLLFAVAAETAEKPTEPPVARRPDHPAEVPLPSAKTAVDGIAALGDLILLDKSSRSLPPLATGADAAAIARGTARILPRWHYLRMPFDTAVSSQFLDRYLETLETLDGLRPHFLKSDIEEFEKYRNSLDQLTKNGDTSPAVEIFGRFMQRLEQRMEYVHHLLKTEQFDFTGDDRFSLNRKEAPCPKDLDDAKQLWRQQLRFEVLQEKLNRKEPKQAARPGSKPGEEKKEDTGNEPGVPTNQGGVSDEIVKNVARRYARTLRFWREFDSDDVLQAYLTALAHVYDPHSDYLGKSTLENFAMSMNLSLFGIGAVLQSEDGYCKIRELKPGPAMRSKKIKPGDKIVAVAQGDAEAVDVVDMKLGKVVEMIRGPKGSKVRLTVMPVDSSDPSERVFVSLIRDEIKIEDEEAKAKVMEIPSLDGKVTRIGIIDLPSFYASFDIPNRNGKASPKSTTEDVARLLKKLKQENVAGMILDLRHNGGGSLEEAINLTGLFIKQGPVVQVRDSNGKVAVDEDWDPSLVYDGPLIVLTSRFSASASEILAAALQDYGRALIVGDSSTFGKGTVQSLMQLEPYLNFATTRSTNNPGALKITVRKFYRASGSSTQLKGVVPEIVLPSVNNYSEVGEAFLEHPLAWDTIPTAKFTPVNQVEPILEELKKRSNARIATDKDFAYVQEDIDLYRKYLAEKSVSLNEEVRRREKQENEKKLETRKQERKARHEPEEKLYELTLKQVDSPGLPAPAARTNAVAKAAADKAADRDDEDADPEDKTPPVDAHLKEARRILMDVIDLTAKETTVARHGLN